MRLFSRMLRDERGATAIEYALMSTLIALVMLGGLSAMSKNANTQYGQLANAIGGESAGGGGGGGAGGGGGGGGFGPLRR